MLGFSPHLNQPRKPYLEYLTSNTNVHEEYRNYTFKRNCTCMSPGIRHVYTAIPPPPPLSTIPDCRPTYTSVVALAVGLCYSGKPSDVVAVTVQ